MSYKCITFVSVKGNGDMTQTTTYNRTTLNGVEWVIERDAWCSSLYRKTDNGYMFTGYVFSKFEDAVKHLDKIDERRSTPAIATTNYVPSDYYGVSNRYYGD